mmetsp:Transcript_45982/g.82793  ORF Transcript_45982/g.82793 Transcript_45982/m.82793 type:complete len:293 (-) Transcript_45982:719-1597(-)|eukprot:CAMPEP_0197650982 /NCGR_PEP_ID=MMETSP1338-20131121/31280_1 /TAXON_ID=43686 ORGANISM="Pelagodinium beii, Strain RCC1491" /NCGR_SAMPLE_ID=MMETSP1338 /ASSEMBLY_ACC=CAM_ASM_000754 /LENGTH=292 /DNA_ID=CAMNT_0043225511 /DNA_START=84 /DNA_END=962 /DNA_ORIENTATION=-
MPPEAPELLAVSIPFPKATNEGTADDKSLELVELGAVRFSPPPRVVLAVLQISSDLVMDMEGSLWASRLDNVCIRYTKMALPAEEICAETYEAAFADGSIHTAIRSLEWPANYTSIWGISCTSLSFTLGKERINRLFSTRYTDMWSSVLAALSVMAPNGRLAVLTPYIKELHQKNLHLLISSGYQILASHNLGLAVDRETTAVDPSFISDSAIALATAASRNPEGAAEVVFIGCSAFRACAPGFISRLEDEFRNQGLSCCVVTSTQAFLWNMLRLSGIQDHMDGYGTLFTQH